MSAWINLLVLLRYFEVDAMTAHINSHRVSVFSLVMPVVSTLGVHSQIEKTQPGEEFRV